MPAKEEIGIVVPRVRVIRPPNVSIRLSEESRESRRMPNPQGPKAKTGKRPTATVNEKVHTAAGVEPSPAPWLPGPHATPGLPPVEKPDKPAPLVLPIGPPITSINADIRTERQSRTAKARHARHAASGDKLGPEALAKAAGGTTSPEYYATGWDRSCGRHRPCSVGRYLRGHQFGAVRVFAPLRPGGPAVHLGGPLLRHPAGDALSDGGLSAVPTGSTPWASTGRATACPTSSNRPGRCGRRPGWPRRGTALTLVILLP